VAVLTVESILSSARRPAAVPQRPLDERDAKTGKGNSAKIADYKPRPGCDNRRTSEGEPNRMRQGIPREP
jgi:hypothetical protein